ncbi:MAG: Type 1 glutamine amidotransferase-like domain-containing protein [Clostridia bacterium]|nr:Type 1 glutamine amidotransferase-like domain-containing protein [Clostridia bacterium]
MLLDAYNRWFIIAGLSAGAICLFEKMYTDSAENTPYKVEEGLGILKGIMSPHYDNRPEFDDVAKDCPLAYAVENNSAIVFEDGVPVKSLSSGGSSYIFNNNIVKKL